MKLTKRALAAINNPETRLELAAELGCTEQWIIRMIAANADNGKLTLMAAFMVIQDRTRLKDYEIIEGLKSPALR